MTAREEWLAWYHVAMAAGRAWLDAAASGAGAEEFARCRDRFRAAVAAEGAAHAAAGGEA